VMRWVGGKKGTSGPGKNQQHFAPHDALIFCYCNKKRIAS
jgi:hypothetical protein